MRPHYVPIKPFWVDEFCEKMLGETRKGQEPTQTIGSLGG